MSAVYLTFVGISAAIALFFVGGIAALDQVVATQVSPAVAALTWRRWRIVFGGGGLLLTTLWAVAAATYGALTHHEGMLDDPVLVIATGLALTISTFMIGSALVSAVALLSPETSVRELLKRLSARRWSEYVVASRASMRVSLEDERRAGKGLNLSAIDQSIATSVALGDIELATEDDDVPDRVPERGRTRVVVDRAGIDAFSTFRDRIAARTEQRRSRVGTAKARLDQGNIADPLWPVFEIAERSLLSGSDLQFERLVDRILEAVMRLHAEASSLAVPQEELQRLSIASAFEDHVDRLAIRAVELGRPDRATAVSRAITRRLAAEPPAEMHKAAFRLAFTLARRFVEALTAAPLCSVIADLANQATAALAVPEPSRNQAFNEVMRGLAELGQRIPAMFYGANEATLTMAPHEPGLAPALPLRALVDATSQILDEVFANGKAPVSAKMWTDAVTVTAYAIDDAAARGGRSDLRFFLHEAVDQLADMGTAAAKVGEAHPAQAAALALSGLARKADPHNEEYRRALATAMAQIAIHAFGQDIRTVGPRQQLGDWIVERMASHLPETLGSIIAELDDRPFDDASPEANERFVATLRSIKPT